MSNLGKDLGDLIKQQVFDELEKEMGYLREELGEVNTRYNKTKIKVSKKSKPHSITIYNGNVYDSDFDGVDLSEEAEEELSNNYGEDDYVLSWSKENNSPPPSQAIWVNTKTKGGGNVVNNSNDRKIIEGLRLSYKKPLIGLIITIIFKIIWTSFKEDLIVGAGIGLFKAFNAFANGLMIGEVLAIGVAFYINNRIKKEQPKEIKVKETPMLKEKEVTKEKLEEYLKNMSIEWERGNEEQQASVQYFKLGLAQIKKVTTIQETLKTFTDSKNEESLSEVFNVLKTTENQIIKNLYNMTNHIHLECSIDGYDEKNILEFLNINDKMIDESQKLLKASLLYMDGKSGTKGIDEYIKSMVETLEKLKKDV